MFQHSNTSKYKENKLLNNKEFNTLDNKPGNLAGYDPPLATGKKIFRRKKPNTYFRDKNNSY